MMKLFKNGVGRPSNETLRKRRMFYYGVTGCIVMLITVGVFALEHFNIINLIGASSASQCKMPYKSTNCSRVKNNTVKKVQELLIKEKLYKDKADGYFGPKTVSAVKSFQKKYKMTQDGHLGIATLKKLAEVTNTRYYLIRYKKNGGSGTLASTMNYSSYPTQFVFYGVSEKISATKLTKKNYVHVGWIASSTWNKKSYYYGCNSTNCTDSAKTLAWYTSGGNNYHSYVYSPSTTVARTGARGNGEVVTFMAQYCQTGYEFNKSISSCVRSSTSNTAKGSNSSSSSGSYVKPTGKENDVDRYTIFVASVCQEDAESVEGAKAVVDTIFNRVDSKDFPNSPWKVLTQKSQFSSYGAGHYRKRLNKNGSLKSGCNNAKKAVDDAFANPKNRSHKYLYFYSNSYFKKSNKKNRPHTIIGGNTYFKW